MTSKVQATREKIDQLNSAENLKLCATNNTIKKMKRPPTEWEKILIYHISDKGIVPRIYKELLQLNDKTQIIQL